MMGNTTVEDMTGSRAVTLAFQQRLYFVIKFIISARDVRLIRHGDEDTISSFLRRIRRMPLSVSYCAGATLLPITLWRIE